MVPKETVVMADYVIVGGGTAGLVLANRLSEDPDIHVLVLEAGENHVDNPKVQIPALFPALQGTEVDYRYHTVAQPALNGRQVKEPQGRLLGGSSALNAQAFIAPSKAGMDAWAAVGNEGWDWAGISPYYKKSYTLTTPCDQATLDHLGIDWLSEDTRGVDGPVQVSFPGTLHNPYAKAWIDAFRETNQTTSGDPFSGTSIGGYSSTQSVDPVSKTRSYAVSAYGVPALQRPNVRLVTRADVQKILFKDSSTGISAIGVEAVVNEQPQVFSTRREVVLCAGAFNTPKLLELSGIGDAALLRRHEITPVIDNPGVGENLQDHLMTLVSFEAVDGAVTMDPLMRQEPEALAQAQKMYMERKEGFLAAGGIQSHAFMPVPQFFADAAGRRLQKELLDAHRPTDAPEAEYYDAVRSIIEGPEEGSAGWFMFPGQANRGGSPMHAESFVSLGFSQCHPLSRGSTHIASSDADVMPTIDPRFGSNPADLEIMAHHLQALEALRHRPAIARLLKPDGKRNHLDAHAIGDLEGARKYVRDTASTTCHSCGTAAMLPRERGGVVGPQLRVYGTDNLRIVDASIFPLIPRGNTQSTVYAVAEKAADIIKGCR